MKTVIVYLDDAAHARPLLPAADTTPMHWVLVACAPRMTHRISKWVSHSARENWRGRWAERLFEQVVPSLRARGDTVTPVLARGPLPELTRELLEAHGPARVLDVRRPKTDIPPAQPGRLTPGTPGSLIGLFAALVLAAD